MLVLENRTDRFFDPVAEMGHLEHLGQDCHQDTDKPEQDQGGNAPDHAVDRVIDGGNSIQDVKKKNMKLSLLLKY